MLKRMRWDKFWAGALGGFCLVLVRLLVEGFFFDQAVNIKGVVLAAVALILIAGVWTSTEDENRFGKLIRFGFAAPGVLILLVSQGTSGLQKRPITPIEVIPTINKPISFRFSFPIATAYAEESSSSANTAVEMVNTSSLKGGVSSGVKAFIGRPYEKAIYAFVIGKTSDRTNAETLALKLKTIQHLQLPDIKVIQIEKSGIYFVIVGSVSTYAQAVQVGDLTKLKSYQKVNDQDKNAAVVLEYLRNGGVVDFSSLVAE